MSGKQTSEPKKFPPTEKKLRDLQKKGQFPKTELTRATLEIVIFSLMFVIGFHLLFENMDNLFEIILTGDLKFDVNFIVLLILFTVGVFFILKLLFAVIDWVLFNKSTVSMEQFGLKIDKLNPINGFKNVFGIEALSRSLRRLFEMTFVCLLFRYVYDIASTELNQLVLINNVSYFVYSLMFYFILASSIFVILGLSLAIIDYLIEQAHFKHKNRMTLTEMKEEMKETEGSPEIKQKRRGMMQEVMNTPMTKGRRPTFALANPTHILVPICFDPKIDPIPVVLKIYTDDLALKQRELLKSMDVPIIENRDLARAMYGKMRYGEDFIPEMFYQDIASILVALKRKTNERK